MFTFSKLIRSLEEVFRQIHLSLIFSKVVLAPKPIQTEQGLPPWE